ncbi:antitoxin Xre/MbcA/ParS toxin-binding domain-containing protein [Polaromonas sp. OV174]|uniref:antitoxin Xre/MbcA/ParS toxin-binding domain-containing protein n=1 Tax=Polaromonas sp. OV174 TaxID=1855300 RepID=UPI000B8258C0|nr:antitoxin Xre/MbcA/ParS toxin-binding domain-containing protein [Polaromonas sp. OV174]
MGTRSNKRRIGRLLHGRFDGNFIWETAEEQAWLNFPPLGGEFGSSDYERFEQLDGYAFDIFQSMELAHEWLSNPHPALDGMTPNESACNSTGLQKTLNLLAGLKLDASTGTGDQVKK